MNYAIHLLIMIGIYLIAAYSLNLVVGFAGLLSLSHAAFYGTGAYLYVLFSMKLGFPFIPAVLSAFVLTGILAFLLSFPALKFRKDYFVLVTLGFQMIFFSILYNWVKVTRGPYGIPGIPRPEIFGYQVSNTWEFLILVVIVDIISISILFLLYSSPFGLSLKALREDELSAESIGKPAFSFFLKAFTISGAFAAISGSLYASYVTYIDPTSFTIDESIFQVSLLLLGGSGNKLGPFIGTVLMILLPEALRFVGLPDSIAANMRQIIYGLTLVLLMLFRPQGIAGEYEVR